MKPIHGMQYLTHESLREKLVAAEALDGLHLDLLDPPDRVATAVALSYLPSLHSITTLDSGWTRITLQSPHSPWCSDENHRD